MQRPSLEDARGSSHSELQTGPCVLAWGAAASRGSGRRQSAAAAAHSGRWRRQRQRQLWRHGLQTHCRRHRCRGRGWLGRPGQALWGHRFPAPQAGTASPPGPAVEGSRGARVAWESSMPRQHPARIAKACQPISAACSAASHRDLLHARPPAGRGPVERGLGQRQPAAACQLRASGAGVGRGVQRRRRRRGWLRWCSCSGGDAPSLPHLSYCEVCQRSRGGARAQGGAQHEAAARLGTQSHGGRQPIQQRRAAGQQGGGLHGQGQGGRGLWGRCRGVGGVWGHGCCSSGPLAHVQGWAV